MNLKVQLKLTAHFGQDYHTLYTTKITLILVISFNIQFKTKCSASSKAEIWKHLNYVSCRNLFSIRHFTQSVCDNLHLNKPVQVSVLVLSFIIALINLSFMIYLSENSLHLINILNKPMKEFPSKLGKMVNSNSTLPEAHLAVYFKSIFTYFSYLFKDN